MNRKSQVTIFLILGLIILSIVALFLFYYAYTGKQPIIFATPSTAAVQKYVQSCVDNVAADAVLFIAAHGGYYDLPELSDSDLALPYYFFDEQNYIPSGETVEKQLALYMDNELFFCLENFAPLEGYKVSSGTVQTTATLEEDGVSFSLYFPVKITGEDAVTTLTDFSATVPTKLSAIYALIEKFMEIQKQDAGSICVSCLVQLGIENTVRVEMYSVEQGVVEFSIIDEEIPINDEALEYHFLNSYPLYSCENLPPDASEAFLLQCVEQKLATYNYTVAIESIPDQEAVVGQEFTYTIKAIGYNLTYEAFANLFTINATTGEMTFVPTKEDVGNHTIWVHVQDPFGNEEYETFVLSVTKE